MRRAETDSVQDDNLARGDRAWHGTGGIHYRSHGDRLRRRLENPYGTVPGIGHIEVAHGIHGGCQGAAESGECSGSGIAAEAFDATQGGDCAIWSNLSNQTVSGVCDEEVARLINTEAGGGFKGPRGDGGDGPGRCHPLNPVVGLVRDVEVTHCVHGNAPSVGRYGCSGPVRGHSNHSAVSRIGDEQVARAMNGHACGKVEIGIHGGGNDPSRRHPANRMVAGIGNVEIARAIQPQPQRATQLGGCGFTSIA